ncbi:AgmX/PglI C-terminal domain-containing protein [Calditrichota bacterium]
MANTQTMTFPREFERQFLRDTDWRFMGILLVTFIIGNAFAIYMQAQPVKELSLEEIQRYNEVIYRVEVTKPKVVEQEVAVATSGDAAAEEEVAEEEAAPEEKAEVSEEQKQAAREAKRESLRAKQEAKRQAIANRIKVLAGPTSKRKGRSSYSSAAGAQVGLSGGAMGGSDMSGMIGFTDDEELAGKVKQMRGGGSLGDDFELGSLEGLSALSADDLSSMLDEAPVELNRSAITAKGRGSKQRQRSQNAIANIVLKNKQQVQYCYWTYKRRDSGLKGRVVVEFTIAPAGDIKRVNFRQSDWGGNSLQRDVEKCIRNIIMQWHFDPIAEKDGDVSAGATFLFE